MTRITTIQDRTFLFAAAVLELTEELMSRSFPARTIAKQLFRSGTSIGANLEEASGAQSKADFISKCSIATKEARESRYWLKLLLHCRGISASRIDPLLHESDEIVAILTTIVKRAATSSNREKRSDEENR
jgi:four helix bundle protein